MREMKLAEEGALVIGIRLANGTEMINPDREHAIPKGTHLIYLAKQPILQAPEV